MHPLQADAKPMFGTPASTSSDVVVIGGGLAGKAASLQLTRAGLRVICIAPTLRCALPWKPQLSELSDTVEDFHAPFSGPLGAWRLMSILRWGNPAEVLASIPAMLPQLKVPTLIFQGSRDKAVPERFAQQACALIPQSEIIIVDSGHFIPLNNLEVVATELLRFFGAAAQA
jgi:pimeloyl-ACP methyl ester carboxylesterase